MQKCYVICLVPIYQIYAQGWKLTGNGNEKGRIGFSLPLALDHYGILLELPKTILKELE
jgi:hypothetical protein